MVLVKRRPIFDGNEGLSEEIRRFIGAITSVNRNLILADPIGYLESKNYPKLFRFLNNSQTVLRNFGRTLNELINNINIFDKCTTCIVSVFLAINALLGKVGGWVESISDILQELTDLLTDLFDNVVALNALSEVLGKFNDRLSISKHSRKVCERLGYCQIS